jgi:hypothetical protein
MIKIKIKNEELTQDLTGKIEKFPLYTTQILNLANQNAQGTRPKIVGQMSDLVQEFGKKNYEEWVKWYLQKMPDAVNDATEKIYNMILKLGEAIKLIDKKLVKKWVKDLVLTKTFVGLCFQEAILKKVANEKGEKFRSATPEEEAKGIDGFIGARPVSIKPETYKTKKMLGEKIDADLIYYAKKKDGIIIEFDF